MFNNQQIKDILEQMEAGTTNWAVDHSEAVKTMLQHLLMLRLACAVTHTMLIQERLNLKKKMNDTKFIHEEAHLHLLSDALAWLESTGFDVLYPMSAYNWTHASTLPTIKSDGKDSDA